MRKAVKRILSSFYPFIRRIYRFPMVKSIEETIDYILENKSSISRYGDSEFLYIIDKISLPYQYYNEELSQRLEEILKSNCPNHLVGLPVGYNSLYNLIPDSKIFWRSQIVWTYPRLKQFLNLEKVYFNASMTRVYVTFDDKSDCGRIFLKLMDIWRGRKLLIIEGEKSRLGVGNNLFAKAKSVERILAPMHHAYDKYDQLLAQAITYDKETLILVALGPTATVLAYDLAQLGYQALDIGNIDIEYEWFLRGASSKVQIPGKYTSEAEGGRIVADIDDIHYEKQIVARIL